MHDLQKYSHQNGNECKATSNETKGGGLPLLFEKSECVLMRIIDPRHHDFLTGRHHHHHHHRQQHQPASC